MAASSREVGFGRPQQLLPAQHMGRGRWTDWSSNPTVNHVTHIAVKLLGYLGLAVASSLMGSSFPAIAVPMVISEIAFSLAYYNELCKLVFGTGLCNS